MKAVILAAGEGSRLRPYTNDRPKCLVEYRGKPILDYTLETLRACGVNDIVVVRGYKGECIVRPGVRFHENPRFAETNMVYTLLCAKAELQDDVIISYGDIIYREGVLNTLLASKAPLSVIVDRKWKELWRQRMENPLDDAETMKLDAEGNIRELGKKPKSYDDVNGQYIGLLKIAGGACREILDFYESLDPAASYDGRPKEKMFMTSFIQLIIDRLMPVKAVMIDGGWLEVDAPEDLNAVMV